MTQKDMAGILGCSVRTVQRDRAAFIARARAYVAKSHSVEDAIQLAKADASVSKARQVAQS